MPLKRHIAYPLVFGLLLIVCSAVFLFLISKLLPGFLESKIISIAKSDAGLADFAVDVRALNLEGADLGSLCIGPPQEPSLVIDSLRMDYSLKEIFQKKIRKITASGVTLYCEYENGKLRLRNLDPDQILKRLRAMQSKDAARSGAPGLSLPQYIAVRHALVIVRVNGKIDSIPFELEARPVQGVTGGLNFSMRMYPRGQLLEASVFIDLETKRASLQAAADNLDLLRFADVIERVEGLNVSGSARLDLKADLKLDPFAISATAARLQADPLEFRYKNLHYSSLSGQSSKKSPFSIDIAETGSQKWQIRVSDLGPVAPLAAALSDFEATIRRSATQWAIFGNFSLALSGAAATGPEAFPLIFDQPLRQALEFSASSAQTGQWHFELSSRRQQPADARSASFRIGQTRIAFQMPRVHLTGNAATGAFESAYTVHLPDVRINSDIVNILLPEFVLKGKTNFSRDSPKNRVAVFDLNLSGAELKMKALEVKLNGLTAGATWQMDPRGLQQITGAMRFTDTRLDSTNAKLWIRQASGSIPFKFPAADTGKKGALAIPELGYQKRKLGAIEGQIHQTASGLSLDAEMKSPLIPQLTARFSANADFLGLTQPQTRVDFELQYPENGPQIDLGKLLPPAEGFTFEGKLSEKGSLVIAGNAISAAAESRLSKGKLRHRENKIAVEDIEMNLLISDLLAMRSAPAQKLRFGRASLGGLDIENAQIDFQIESADSLLIEKSRMNWCDGRVDAPAIRLRPTVQDYSLILYCDRLNLAKVLEQFGAARVEGKGQLNGQIPLRYKNGQLSFQDGFLYTTPGESGKIRMTNTEILTVGIPPNTPQYVQMELARKALEDYDYSWARLNLTTEGEDLLLQMQLDGKPGKPLPFVYRKDMGGFAKVEADVEGSTFQGIRLDVNFRLPLNKIMQYKELIQMIQQSRE